MFKIVRRGTVKKVCQMDQGSSELIFENALYTPGLASNLISITKFDRASFSVIFGRGQVCFQDPNRREVM